MALIDRCTDYHPQPAEYLGAQRGALQMSLPLRHGGLAETQFHFELVGDPGAPLLIVAGGISADRHLLASPAFPEPGWWQAQAASLRPAAYRILSVDWLGADGQIDTPIDPRDQAEAIGRLLDHLDIGRAAAFIGASYGGMVGMHLAARFPGRVQALLAISAAHRPHPYASGWRALQRQALTLAEAGGDAAAGVALARAIAMLTYRTPDEFAERFTAAPQIVDGRLRVAAEDYLDRHGARHRLRMSGIAYRRLSESIDLHHVDPAVLRIPLTLVAVDRDALVPVDQIRSLADAVPESRFHLIQSRFGHDGFLKEEGRIAGVISEFLASLETI